MKLKFGVVTFPGSNSDHDLIYVIKEIMSEEVVQLWHKSSSLEGCNVICLPGGFAHGDYLRSGAIARFSPIMKEIVKFAEKGGNVFGICNGFQILTEAQLLPGVLLRNNGLNFICKNVNIFPVSDKASLVSHLEKRSYKMPIAHGEGNYYCDENTLKDLEENEQILFKYTANPNGSLMDIAGICNKNRNVWGMMPHPERAADPYVGNEDGKYLFESIIKSLM